MTTIRETIALLSDETLIWSDDFESVRLPLAALLRKAEQLNIQELDDELDDLLFALTGSEIPPARVDPMQQWLNEAIRQLGIFEQVASRSERSRNAITFTH